MPETLIFEPHSLFRHEPIDGEEFPFGYISKAPGQPIFALHEAFVDAPVEELARIARLFAAAPELLKACSDWIDWLKPDSPKAQPAHAWDVC